jgi:hypothetical protein
MAPVAFAQHSEVWVRGVVQGTRQIPAVSQTWSGGHVPALLHGALAR